jgi:hypothetical protein
VNDGRYVRWVPEQPGHGTTRTTNTTFSRTDTRLTRWNQPMPGGTVTSRGSVGRTGAAGGQVSAQTSARGSIGGTGRGATVRSAGQAGSHPFPEGGGRVSAVRAGPGIAGRSAGGGKALPRYSAPGTPGRGPVRQEGARYYGGGQPPGAGRGYAYPSTGGRDTGYRGYGTVPHGVLDAGSRDLGGAVRSFGGGDFRGDTGGARGFGGGWGGGWGGRGSGGGFRRSSC